jgi:hypothetical protein
MASSHIARNALVAPFSVNSPLLEPQQTNDEKGGKSSGKKPVSTLAPTHQKWFLQVQTAINGTAQITATIPASSNSEGEPGTFAFDSHWLYVAVGKNTWRRAALNAF